MAAAIMAMAQGLDPMVVAAGIENEEQRTWLRHHGCQYGQGSLFGKPMKAGTVESLFK